MSGRHNKNYKKNYGHDDRYQYDYSANNTSSYNSNTSSYKKDNQEYRGGKSWGRSRKSRGVYNKDRRQVSPRSYMDEDDVNMGDGISGHDSKQRYTPYGGNPNRRGINKHQNHRGSSSNYRGRGNKNLHRGPRPLETVDKTGYPFAWFKVTVPFGKKMEKAALLNTLVQLMTKPLLPIQFRYVEQGAVFYIQEKEAAEELKKLTGRVTLESGYKLITIVRGCDSPYVDTCPENLELLKTVFSRRYDASTKALNLCDLVNDEVLKEKSVYLPLQKLPVMRAAVNIIAENIPELEQLDLSNNKIYTLMGCQQLAQSASSIKRLNLANNRIGFESELERINDIDLIELKLDSNPLCKKFDSTEDYVRAVRKQFPKVLILDGTTLPPPISFDIESEGTLPPAKDSYFPNTQVQELIGLFLQQYYGLFDNIEQRSKLIEAYHDEALISLTFHNNKTIGEYKQTPFSAYYKLHHNLVGENSKYADKKIRSGKVNVVSFLSDLPRTEHYLKSFIIDVTCLQQTMMTFTVTGLFKEFFEQRQPVYRYFSRLFVTVPQGAGIVVVNEQISITNATQMQIKKLKASLQADTPVVAPVAATPAPTAASDMAGQISIEQKQQMVLAFSEQSGMNIKFSEDCLNQNDWHFQKSAKVFMDLKNENKIPPEAFEK